MDKVGIHTDRIDLAVFRLKIRVILPKILQLRGAHKSKIRRIEKQNGPVPQQVFLGIQPALPLAIAEYRERLQGFVNQMRHRQTPFIFLIYDYLLYPKILTDATNRFFDLTM
jgi:hypothetical protein